VIVGVVGAAGGVGTTTVGLLLSAAIAEHGPGGPDGPDGPGIAETVFIEVDRAGGVAGARFELGVHGGLRSWVAGLATDPALDVSRFGKLGADRWRIVAGPEGCTEAERVLSPHATELLASAITADRSRRWVLDLGRGGAAVSPLATAADSVVMVSSGAREEVVRLPSLVSWCRPARCVVVLGGRAPWPPEEVRHHCQADVVLAGEEMTMPNSAVVDLIEGRRRGRSRVWRTVLACRDAVLSPPVTPDVRERSVS